MATKNARLRAAVASSAAAATGQRAPGGHSSFTRPGFSHRAGIEEFEREHMGIAAKE